MKVLVSDSLAEIGLKIFRETPGISVDVKTGLKPEELKAIIGQYDGLAIRSATKVTAEIIETAYNLKVVGRAGIGLDNVDIKAASKRGIAVMNTPEGNTITTAEHTISMIMALSRNIPQATASLKEGKWEKKKLEGRELFNKTLGLIGVGKIGRIVADRAKGLKMKVIAHDPYLQPEVIEKMDLEPVSFEQLLQRADYITIHTPKTSETTNLMNKETLAKMKKGAMLINCARGGIVNEDDLYEALSSGHLGGAALDVFTSEPPGKIKLMECPNFICTPHLGASTKEAQENVAKDVTEQIVAFLLQGTVKNAVNMPAVSAELMSVLQPYASLTEKLGILAARLTDSPVEEIEIKYEGKITEYNLAPLTTAAVKGVLTSILKEDVNFINAPFIAADRGIKILETKTEKAEDFSTLIVISVKSKEGKQAVSGTIFGKNNPRILRINDLFLEAIPEGHLLFIYNQDIPGAIGHITTLLGKGGINIDRMHVGQDKEKRRNAILLATNPEVDHRVLGELGALSCVLSVRKLEL